MSSLSDIDFEFTLKVQNDVQKYLSLLQSCDNKSFALLFPPLNNFRRFQIHSVIQENFSDSELRSVSVGKLNCRRTAVFLGTAILQQSTTMTSVDDKRNHKSEPIRTKPKLPSMELYRPPAARAENDVKTNRTVRQRRPDMQIYVPLPKRILLEKADTLKNDRTAQLSQETIDADKIKSDYPSVKDKYPGVENFDKHQQHSPVVDVDNTFDKTDEKNVIVNPRDVWNADLTDVISFDDGDIANAKLRRVVLNRNKSKRPDTDDRFRGKRLDEMTQSTFSSDIDQPLSNTNFYSIENRFELDDIHPSTENENKRNDDVSLCERIDSRMDTDDYLRINDDTTNSQPSVLNEIKTENSRCVNKNRVPDRENENHDANVETTVMIELEDNNFQLPVECNSVPVESSNIEQFSSADDGSRDGKSEAIKNDGQEKVSVTNCDWDELFDENGEYINEDVMEELMSAIGNVSIKRAPSNYQQFQSNEERTSDGESIIEIYGFPAEFKTPDLVAVFSDFKDDGFQLSWVDDTHALGIFSSPSVADRALNTELSFVKTRPLKEAISKSKYKAKNFVLAPAVRPQTCVVLARRLVSASLGVKINVTDSQRRAESKLLSDARAKRKQETKQKKDRWEEEFPENVSKYDERG